MKINKLFKGLCLSSAMLVASLSVASCSKNEKENYTNLNIMKLEISSDKKIRELEYFNKNIKELVIREGVTIIPKKAFMNNLIEEIKIPNSVEVIEDYAFEGNRIKRIEIDIENSNLKEVGTSAFGYVESNQIKLNEKLEKIANGTFKNSKIDEVDLSKCKKLEIIPEEAFYNSSISTLKLNDNLKEIKRLAFMENNISNFITPKNLEKIGQDAFNSNSINKVVFDNIIQIQDGAFQSNKIKMIGREAFANQQNIDYINILVAEKLEFSLQEKLYRPFGNYYLDDNIIKTLNIIRIEDYFNIKDKILYGFKKDIDIEEYFGMTNNGTHARTLKIPYLEVVDTIAEYAFNDMQIDNVVFENNIKKIQKAAFKNNKIKSLFINIDNIEIEDEAFFDNPFDEINLNSNYKEKYEKFLNSNIEINFL